MLVVALLGIAVLGLLFGRPLLWRVTNSCGCLLASDLRVSFWLKIESVIVAGRPRTENRTVQWSRA